jgi:hypothetical protein
MLFFESQEYQISHIQFPLEVVTYDYDNPKKEVKRRHVPLDYFEYFSGQYSLDESRLDRVIYDNFERKMKESSERVLSRECLNNKGVPKYCIFDSYYFKKENEKWNLVKYAEYFSQK